MSQKMEGMHLVDGAGWVSEESDFYGSETLRTELEKKGRRKLRVSAVSLPASICKVKRLPVSRQRNKHQKGDAFAVLNAHPATTAPDLPVENGNAEANDSYHEDRFVNDPSAWQQHETIIDFMRRAPVNDPSTAGLGPWLWVRNPRPKAHWRHRELKTDINAFVEGGIPLLEAHSALRIKIEKVSPDTPVSTITRRLGPYRDQLETDLLALAVKTSTTCGKWMLFPSDDDYPRYWRVVAEATAESKLGPTSKAAKPDPVEPLNLICVYTYDFSDADDVRRVLEELIDLGLCARDGKPLYYKCDAYTYLDIKSGNEYKLRASVYSSKELLGQQAKPQKEGPVDRSVKRKVAADSSWIF